MKKRTFSVILERDDLDNRIVATVPELPGCFTEGDTEAQAIEHVQEAIIGNLVTLAKRGETVPETGQELGIEKVSVAV